jgi:pyruvate formate lyase activating enzyme
VYTPTKEKEQQNETKETGSEKMTQKINYAGFVPLSTVDWPGKSACTVFFKGCPFRCLYCHNYEHIDSSNMTDEQEIKDKIRTSSNFISGVVFSGGEATIQPDGLLSLANFAKNELGLSVSIHTNGYNPDVIKTMYEQNLLDKVFIDLKADPSDTILYDKVCGLDNNNSISNVSKRVVKSIHLVHDLGIDTELRTTVFKNMVCTDKDMKNIAIWLNENITNTHQFEYIIQQGNLENVPESIKDKLIEINEDEIVEITRKNIIPYFTNVFVRTSQNLHRKVE